MDLQIAFNIAMGLVAFLGGYVLRSISETLKSLQATDSDLTEKVQAIEVLVAGQYVRTIDFTKMVDALFFKLDKISDKIDTKMDKC